MDSQQVAELAVSPKAHLDVRSTKAGASITSPSSPTHHHHHYHPALLEHPTLPTKHQIPLFQRNTFHNPNTSLFPNNPNTSLTPPIACESLPSQLASLPPPLLTRARGCLLFLR
ncbi:hypothetical protein ACSQ67_024428 [Phaseolus vulgaris]